VAKLNWTAEAERWLNDIFSYIAADNSKAAKEVVEGMYRRAQLLQDFPEAGYRYEGASENIRILLYGHYRIAYLQRADGDIDILGVFHGSLDIDRYLV